MTSRSQRLVCACAAQLLLFRASLDQHDISVKAPRPSAMEAGTQSAAEATAALQAAIAMSVSEMVDE